MQNEHFKDTFIALDLEMNQPSGKIIQIGAAIGTYIIDDPIESISIMVNPGEDINPEITTLTGITDDDVDKGDSLKDAFFKLMDFIEGKDLFMNPVTWGGGDSIELKDQLREAQYHDFDPDDYWKFGRRWIDAKTEYVGYRIINGKQPSGGLAKAMTHLGLAFKGRKHNAEYDAINTLVIWRKLISLKKNL